MRSKDIQYSKRMQRDDKSIQVHILYFAVDMPGLRHRGLIARPLPGAILMHRGAKEFTWTTTVDVDRFPYHPGVMVCGHCFKISWMQVKSSQFLFGCVRLYWHFRQEASGKMSVQEESQNRTYEAEHQYNADESRLEGTSHHRIIWTLRLLENSGYRSFGWCTTVVFDQYTESKHQHHFRLSVKHTFR